MPSYFKIALAVAALASPTMAAVTYTGCYSDPPAGAVSMGGATNANTCADLCSSYQYSFYTPGLLGLGADCQCSNTLPASSGLSLGLPGLCLLGYEADLTDGPASYTGCGNVLDVNGNVAPVIQVADLEACLSACRLSLYINLFADPSSSTGQGCSCGSSFSGATCDTSDPSSNSLVYANLDVATPSAGAQRRARRYIKRQRQQVMAQHCPKGLTACNVAGAIGAGAYECVDIDNDLESCGGCLHGEYNNVSAAVGQDCTAIGAAKVGGSTCTKGECVIYQCRRGFALVNGACVSQ
ncbi:hypothetical protein IAR55_003092 [Kwoniella newhampshirensis]|uniref:Protein CPL1-like domain-containing protein n=1 Tax=Kwoniella newhampshirensis TaxID=1651941 RepID=A0AAW0Z0J2_9TREE